MAATEIQYVSNENGEPTGVLVPIELWREITSERATAYLLRSEAMRRRLIEAKNRNEGIPFEDVCDRLGI
jgi:PHD/YefM family antitoxin component YafN of YafNO toxin-antitoxin module